MSQVLIIDDDPSIVGYLSKALEADGHSSCSVAIEQEVDRCLCDQPPDLVVLNLEIAHEWGPKFYRSMVQDPKYKNIPVIIIGGMSGIQFAVTGAAASFKKPVNPEELAKAILDMLRG